MDDARSIQIEATCHEIEEVRRQLREGKTELLCTQLVQLKQRLGLLEAKQELELHPES